jgi:hypothetical protein
MPTWVLFLVPTLIWASTWHVITYQLGSVPVLNSVTWRFALAALCLALWAWQRGQSLRPGPPQPRADAGHRRGAVLRQLLGRLRGRALPALGPGGGAVLDAGVQQRAAGLVALAAAGQPALPGGGRRGRWPAWCWCSGPSWRPAAPGPTPATACWVALGALAASCAGGFMTMSLTRRGLPLLPVLAWSMGYGALFMLLLSLLTGQGLHFDTGWPLCAVVALPEPVRIGDRLRLLLQARRARRHGQGGADGSGDPGHRAAGLGALRGLAGHTAGARRHGRCACSACGWRSVRSTCRLARRASLSGVRGAAPRMTPMHPEFGPHIAPPPGVARWPGTRRRCCGRRRASCWRRSSSPSSSIAATPSRPTCDRST